MTAVIDLNDRRREVEALCRQYRSQALKVMNGQVRHVKYVDRESMESAAMEGLWEAARHFDPSHGVPFTSYLNRIVRGRVKDEMRRMDPLSRHDREKVTRFGWAEEKLTGVLHRDPSVAEVARAAGLSEPEAARCACLLRSGASATLDTGWARTTIVADDAPGDDNALAEVLALVPATLSGRQLECVVWSLEGLSCAEIAKRWGVSDSRVSQIYHAAARRLRLAAQLAGLVESGDAA